MGNMKNLAQHKVLPENGMEAGAILEKMRHLQEADVAWKDGRTWSLVYYAGEEHDRLLKDAYEMYFSSNYLNPFAFKSLQMMEKEVVQMCAAMLHGGDTAVGTMSSGGTESILLAVYTYREWAKANRPGIRYPEMVAPATVHPAFDKAAHLFGLRIRKAPVDETMRAHPGALEHLINSNTILLVASAPSYPNGVLDPIPEIGNIAQKHRLPFHVDACIGGFILPWMEREGHTLPCPWDFRVPGVTSMSADIHKFGYSAKGASVILYRGMEYLRHQFFIATEFPGGIYISPTLMGTRPGGAIAAAWAGMMHLGQNGYRQYVRQMIDGTNHLRTLLSALPEIEIIGDPCMNILSYTTKGDRPDLFAVADRMEYHGWMVDRQQTPDCIHLTLTPTNVPAIDRYVEDLKESLEYARLHPHAAGEGNAALYGMMARIPFRGMVEMNVRQLLENMYANHPTELHESPKPDTITPPTPGWMGLISRILAYWKRL